MDLVCGFSVLSGMKYLFSEKMMLLYIFFGTGISLTTVSVNGGATELVASLGGSGLSPSGDYSVCVRRGDVGDFVKASIATLRVGWWK